MRLIVIFLAFGVSAPAFAGSCRISSYGTASMQSCDNGYVEMRGHGWRRHWGIRNGGSDRYSGARDHWR